MEINYIMIAVIVAVALILFYFGYSWFIKKKDLKSENLSTIDIQELLIALGGKDNICEVKSSPSKLTVVLRNREIVNIQNIQKLGASGIVEGKEQLSMIFGKQSELIEKDLKKIL